MAIACVFAVACAGRGPSEYAAYGFLSPTPTGDGEMIGVYRSLSECEAAADEWTARQVVGNPVSAACYPVDRD